MSNHISGLAYACGQPNVSGLLKQSVADFIVTEQLGFEPSAEGEHLFLKIKKKNLNTLDVCEKIAKHFRVAPRNVAYAGLKDKKAITTQWFSLPCPIKTTPDINGLESDAVSVVEFVRNTRKLKRGAIKNNHFEITLRNIKGDVSQIEERIQSIIQSGVPNYFGAQRFGRNENNLLMAKKLFTGRLNCSRHKKSLYLSAARSFLFNEIVSRRVENNTWNSLISGDVAVLDNTRSFFVIHAIDNETQSRLQQGDIHPSAPLWGNGEPLSSGKVRDLEGEVIHANAEFSEGLVEQGLLQDRRAMRLFASNLEYQLTAANLVLKFSLPAGTYATSVLREILQFSD